MMTETLIAPAADKDRWTLGGIALAGVYGNAPNTWASYSSASITTYDKRPECYFWRLADGAPFVDKRPCGEETIYRNVVGGPMVEPSLPDGYVYGFQPPRPAEPGEKFGSLTMIATDLYLALWRGLGARIGFRRGNVMAWEDGTTEPIVKPAWETKE